MAVLQALAERWPQGCHELPPVSSRDTIRSERGLVMTLKKQSLWSMTLVAVALTAGIAAQQQAGRGDAGGGGRGRGNVELPDGDAKATVNATCGGCHALNMITGAAGYTQDGWRSLISTMVRLPEPQQASITLYLAAHFPPKPGRAPTLVPGSVTVTFREWIVPTLGQRSRDPLQRPDGTIWWNGQFISLVGSLDPRSGEMREYKLEPEAHPHSIVDDAAGNIWYMGNGNGTIGKLVPGTGEITIIKMPDPAARDPHTGIFDKNGTLFFTLQQSNMLGRLTPSTGEIKLVTLTTPRALPYGIKQDSKGTIWVSYNGSNKLASMDPVTMEVREHVLPDPATRSRRLAITSDDTVWFVNSSLGRLGRLIPKTGEIKEWPSPSGPQSHPYAIEVVDDVIWYNESGMRPDALVRFDPKTEKFQSWAIPSGVGIVRHMRKTPDGNLTIHQTSSNRIGLAIIDKPASSGAAR
jgi:virginiamycin B lyase